MYEKETIRIILRNKRKIEKKLRIKIKVVDNEVETEGEEVDCYVASRIFDAIERNFPIMV